MDRSGDPPAGWGHAATPAGVTLAPGPAASRPIATTPAESATTPPPRPAFRSAVDQNQAPAVRLACSSAIAPPASRADADAMRVRIDALHPIPSLER